LIQKKQKKLRKKYGESVKPKIAPPNTDRPLQPEFFYEPLITNKIQNDQANLAKLEITRFRHTEFEVTTVGIW